MAYEVKTPYDAASGLSTGRRQYTFVTITKDWSAASPQLHQAVVTSERLTVLIERYRAGANGAEQVVETIELKQAKAVGIRHYSEGSREMEAVSFTFQTMDFTNKAANTAMSDSRSTP
ncbi:MAG: type VI secretion system tube protein Hcp [Gemmatimonadaceae bacterium]